MSIHMDIIPMNRLVVIVARGHVTAEEIAENAKKLIAANSCRRYALLHRAGRVCKRIRSRSATLETVQPKA